MKVMSSFNPTICRFSNYHNWTQPLILLHIETDHLYAQYTSLYECYHHWKSCSLGCKQHLLIQKKHDVSMDESFTAAGSS